MAFATEAATGLADEITTTSPVARGPSTPLVLSADEAALRAIW
jgi:hypothetical protein